MQVAAVVALVLTGRQQAQAEPVELPTQHLSAVTMAVVQAERLLAEMEAPEAWSAASCSAALAVEQQLVPQVRQETAEMRPASALAAAAAALHPTLPTHQAPVATVHLAFAL